MKRRVHSVFHTLSSRLLAGLLAMGLILSACSAPAHTESTAKPESSASAAVSTAASGTADTGSSVQSNDRAPLRVIGLKGPTSIGMAQLADTASGSTSAFSFSMANAPDAIAPALVKGEVDVAAVPSNLAAVLYAKTHGAIRVLNINTLGVLYLVEKGETVHSFADLRGKTIVASGKGSTPEYALRYLLQANGLTDADVKVEWKAEHAEALAALSQNADRVALLPEPFVTTALSKMPDLHIALDLTKVWDATQTNAKAPSALVMGVLVARKEVVEKRPEDLARLLDACRRSIQFVTTDPKAAAPLVEKLGIVPAAVAEKAIPRCNIVDLEGQEMKEKLSGFLQVLFDSDPAAVGGALPDDAFYYIP